MVGWERSGVGGKFLMRIRIECEKFLGGRYVRFVDF